MLAAAIVNAAEERSSGMTEEQVPHSTIGVLKAAASHLSKREQRETGSVHPGSPAAKALAAYNSAVAGHGGEVEKEVAAKMKERGWF